MRRAHKQPVLLWLVSPTRATARKLRAQKIVDFCSVISWNLIFYGIEAVLAALLCLEAPTILFRAVICIAIYILFSRILELLIAFYGDAFRRQLNFYDPGLPIIASERMVLLTLAYVEIIWAFGIVYAALSVAFNAPVLSHTSGFFDAVFFSATTLTTTGSGEIAPIAWSSKAFAVFEAVTGIVFIAMALSGYLGRQDEGIQRDPQTLASCFRKKRKPVLLVPDSAGNVVVKPEEPPKPSPSAPSSAPH